MTFRLVHISDSHFGTELEGVKAALKEYIYNASPDLILFSGDITQRARATQFKAAKKFMNDLHPFPVLVIPGNHDIPLFNFVDRALFPYRNFNRYLTRYLNKEFRLKGVQVFALNSTSRFRHIQGRISLKKLKRLFKVQDMESQFRVVCFHHPFDCAKEVDEKNLLLNREEALPIFSEGSVDLVLGGHIHDPHVALSSDRYVQSHSPFVVAVAGTCISRRVRKNAPNSFNWIEFQAQEGSKLMSIKRIDLSPDNVFEDVAEWSFENSNQTGWRSL